MTVDINCDMGEGFGLYKMGDDEGLMPFITEANIACGFHASDPNHMRRTVELAKQYGVKIGAHFSLPDRAGFGRREMQIDRDELANIVIYQIGALSGFLAVAGVSLSHLKPHGALYSMAAREEHVAHAIADVGEHFRVPIFGLAGTLHEEIYTARGLEFRAEFFADLDYDELGNLLITREHDACRRVWQLTERFEPLPKDWRAVSPGLTLWYAQRPYVFILIRQMLLLLFELFGKHCRHIFQLI